MIKENIIMGLRVIKWVSNQFPLPLFGKDPLLRPEARGLGEIILFIAISICLPEPIQIPPFPPFLKGGY
jgi:hypothetical protein